MSYFRGTLLACTTLFTLYMPAAAQAETLSAAIESALNQHPAIAAARANREAQAAEESEKFAQYFPRVSATAQAGRIYGDNSTSRGLSVTRGSGYSWLGEGSVTLSQMLFDGFETPRRVAAAGARTEAAAAGIVDMREQLALKTTLAYLDVLRTREAYTALHAHREKMAGYHQRIQAMVAEGAADKSMEAQARDLQIQLDATTADIESQYRLALAQYQEMTGRAPADPMPRPVLRAEQIPATQDEAVTRAVESNPALKASRLTDSSYDHDARAESGLLYPDINADLSYLKSDKEDVIGGELTDARAVVKLNWSLSTGGAELARIRKAKHRAAESRARTEELRRQIERAIAAAWSEMATATTQYNLQKERETVNRELFASYESQFEAARINLLQLLQADNGHFNTTLALLNADYRLLASRYNILASMGLLQEALNVVPVTAVAAADDHGR